MSTYDKDRNGYHLQGRYLDEKNYFENDLQQRVVPKAMSMQHEI